MAQALLTPATPLRNTAAAQYTREMHSRASHKTKQYNHKNSAKTSLENSRMLRATRQRAPVPCLVFAASSASTCSVAKASVVDIASGLQLGAESRQWRVEAIAVENMAGGLHRGCQWLLRHM